MELSWNFVPQGPTALPPNHQGLALDVATRSETPGVWYFTHHGEANPRDPGFGRSSTGLLHQGIEQLEALRRAGQPIVIFCHSNPDVDCFASSYLAWAFLRGTTGSGEELWRQPDFAAFATQLAALLDRIDGGHLRPARPDDPASHVNFYTLFLFLDVYLKNARFGLAAQRPPHLAAMVERADALLPGCRLSWDRQGDAWMGTALCLLQGLYLAAGADAPRYLQETDGALPSLDPVLPRVRETFGAGPHGWLADLWGELFAGIKGWMREVAGHLQPAPACYLDVRVPEQPAAPLLGVFLELNGAVAGAVAKLLRGCRPAGAAGPILVTAVALTDDPNRAILSVPPAAGLSLKGLGLALHHLNLSRGCPRTERSRYYRRLADGRRAPDPLFDHADPWYDGRDFAFSIVDAPRDPRYRCLDPETIRNVLAADWHQLAAAYETPAYRAWLQGSPDQPPAT